MTLVDVLKHLYPDIHFDVQQDARLAGRISIPGQTLVIMWKECPNGKKAGITLAMSPDFMENAPPEILKANVEEAVRKLREYCEGCPSNQDNPSSRWFA